MNVNKKTVKIWEKNFKQGYRFFQPHNAIKLTPRTLREAFGHKVYQEIKNEELYFKETTKAYIATIVIALLAIAISFVHADDYWESSPYNWKNSTNNWDNTEYNWKNSPNNWDNSPNNYNSKTIIRNEQGKPTGYVVPKTDGGVNYYDLKGNRKGYSYE